MNDDLKFSWTMMLLVSGFSAFLFSFFMKFLEGSHSRLLILIGATAVTAGILSWIMKQLFQKSQNKKGENITV